MQTSSCTILLYTLFALQTVLGMGMGMNVTAQGALVTLHRRASRRGGSAATGARCLPRPCARCAWPSRGRRWGSAASARGLPRPCARSAWPSRGPGRPDTGGPVAGVGGRERAGPRLRMATRARHRLYRVAPRANFAPPALAPLWLKESRPTDAFQGCSSATGDGAARETGCLLPKDAAGAWAKRVCNYFRS